MSINVTHTSTTGDGFGRDVAMSMLRMDQEMFRLLVERNPQGFVLGRMAYDDDRQPVNAQVVFANDAFTEHTGMPAGALTGRWVADMLEDVWLEVLDEVVRSQEPVSFIRHHQDSQRWYEAYIFPVGADGYGEFFRDVTDRQSLARNDVERFGPLSIDYGQQTAELDGVPLALTASEFILLATLSRSPGSAVSAQDLMSAVRGFEWTGDDAALDVHVSRLRRKLGEDGRRQRMIRTVRGIGYLFQG